MRKFLRQTGLGLSLIAGVALLGVGCGKSDTSTGQVKDANAGKGGQVAKSDDKKEGDSAHSGWWCDEHGVPEAECSMCSPKVAADFKKKGDWCEKHDRAKSQCFLCDPKLKEKYAAQYRAKFGKEPPATEEETKGKEGEKK